MKVDKTKWIRKTLKDIVLTIQNINWRNNDNCYQYIDLTSVDRETKNIVEAISINANNAPSRAKLIVNRGDVIFATTRPTQMRAAIISEKYHNQICSTGYCVLRPSESNINSSFLFYCLQSNKFKQYLSLREGGAAYPAVSNGVVLAYTIPLPPFSIQQAIASELDAIQTMIDGYKAQLADLDALAQSIFLDMFGDPVTNPKGWNLQTLKEVCSHIVDCPHSTPQKSAIPTEYPCIRTSELTDSGIEWNTMQYLNEEEYLKRTHRLKPQFGDLIYGREGTVGGCIMVPKEKHFSLGQRTMLFRPSKINSYLLLAIIRSPWIRNQAELKTVGQTVKHINIKDIIEFTIPVPPRTLQQHFATQVEAIELQKELLRQQLADAETLMAERMQYYFS